MIYFAAIGWFLAVTFLSLLLQEIREGNEERLRTIALLEAARKLIRELRPPT